MSMDSQTSGKMSIADETLLNPSSVSDKKLVKQATSAKRRRISHGRDVLEYQVYHSPLDRSDWVFFGGLALVTALAIATRLYKITEPRHVA